MKAVLLLLLACSTVAVQGASVTLRIAAEPDALLPGIYPPLRIWITNDGSAPAEVPTRVALQVIPPRGEPFIAYTSMRDERFTTELVSKTPLILAPGETRDVSFWWRDEWFSDARFRTTGAFHLQVIADRGLDSDKLSGLTRVLDQPGLGQPLLSNVTRFTALEPAGVDLAVWNAVKGSSATCTPEATKLIWEQYPASGYAAYCVRRRDGDALQQIAAYEASLAKSPHPYWAEAYRLNIAHQWISRGFILTDHDVDAAVDAYERARAALEPLSRAAAVPQHRQRAAELLETSIPTRADIVEEHQAAHGFDDRPIRFYASCFENLPGGSRRIWFGYNNPNSKAIDVAVGNDNKFTPPPFNRAQPVTFRPGIFDFAFNIVTKEPTLVWHLQGKTAQFKLPDTIQCPKGFDPNDPSTWQVEEE